MRLALSTFTYTWSVGVPGSPPAAPWGVDALVDACVELGVDALQIADNLPLHTLDDEDRERLRARAVEHGLGVEVGTRGIATEHLREYLRIAVRLGSPILRIVVDSAGDHPTPDEVVARLAPLRGEFVDAGVRLAIENHDRFPAGVLADVVTRLGTDWAGICLDTVNSFGALEGPQVVVQTLAPLAINLHVKDFVVRRADHMMGFAVEGTAAGEGSLDVPWLLSCLAGVGDVQTAVIELWTPPAASLAETIEREQEWARRSVTYLRPLVAAQPA